MAALAAAPAAWPQAEVFQLSPGGAWEAKPAAPLAEGGAQVNEARRLLAAGDTVNATIILDRFIDAYDLTENPFLPEAYLLRGDVTTVAGNEYQALYDYEHLIERFRATPQFVQAVERELEIGIRYLNGYRRKVFGLRVGSAWGTGEELLARVAERLPGSRAAERAIIELADYYFRERELKNAAEAYELFLKLFPRSEYRAKAMERRIAANVARAKGPKNDVTGLIEAKYLIDDFAHQYPAEADRAGINDALRARIEEKEADHMLASARWYLRRGDAVSARFTLRRVAARFPATIAGTTARRELHDRRWEEKPAAAAGAPAGAGAATIERRPMLERLTALAAAGP